MKLSRNWLSDFVDLSGIESAQIVSALTRSTCEVEGYADHLAHLEDVVIARISKREAHPNADRLSLCTVEAGGESLRVVCGAPNAAAGLLVPLARVGAQLPGPDGPLVIRPAKIRGVESSGMLCAARELGLEELMGDGDGLLVLEPSGEELLPGRTLADALGLRDVVFDIDNKSITHRPDLWSHYGFARELALLFDRPLQADPLLTARFPTRKAVGSLDVAIEEGAAKAYFGAIASGVRVVPSPLPMRARLLAVGQRPINNIVDATNYMMLESGQPNHAFDRRRIRTQAIGVGRAGREARFTTLDEEERRVPKGTVMILDGPPSKGKPLALAGVMGGLESAVADDTTELFLESATFHREDIRRTLAATALRTESAVRFEKGQNPANARPGIARLAGLLSETCPQLELGPLGGELIEKPRKNRIQVSAHFVNVRLGLELRPAEMKRTLERLGFVVELSKGRESTLKVTAPAYRSQYDVTIPEDVVEEIGRIYGYGNIEPRAPLFAVEVVPVNFDRSLERRLKQGLVDSGGFFETNNYSFARVEDNERFGNPGVRLANPSFHDRDRMRISLIPGMLRQVAGNQDRYRDVRLFEVGRSYLPEPGEDTPARELRRLVAVHLPPEDGGDERERPGFLSYLEMRRVFEDLFAAEAIAVRVKPADSGTRDFVPVAEHLHPACRVEWHGPHGRLGSIGILHPGWRSAFDLKREAVVAEVFLDRLAQASSSASAAYRPPSQFPESYFELSVLLDARRSTADPLAVLESLPEPTLGRVELLGTYAGDPLPAGKKSASYRVSCGLHERTLTGEEVQELRGRCITALESASMPLR